jgi:hypothetical protein
LPLPPLKSDNLAEVALCGLLVATKSRELDSNQGFAGRQSSIFTPEGVKE